MADFNQAIKWMKEGKKVRSKSVSNDQWYLFKNESQGSVGFIFLHHSKMSEPKIWGPNLSMLEKTDWEIYCDHEWIVGKYIPNDKGGVDATTYCVICDIEEPKENLAKFLQRLGTDGQLWAKEFMKKFEEKKEEIDEELMRSWFANAIMAGHDKK